MKTFPLLLLFSFSLFNCTSHTRQKKVIIETEIPPPPELNSRHLDEIGFACGEGGDETSLVGKYSEFIRLKNYWEIKKGLYSNRPGDIFMATMSCEKLAREGIISLNPVELKQIARNRLKKDSVFSCSGCTEFSYFTLKQLFQDSSNFINQEAGCWFDHLLEINYLKQTKKRSI